MNCVRFWRLVNREELGCLSWATYTPGMCGTYKDVLNVSFERSLNIWSPRSLTTQYQRMYCTHNWKRRGVKVVQISPVMPRAYSFTALFRYIWKTYGWAQTANIKFSFVIDYQPVGTAVHFRICNYHIQVSDLSKLNWFNFKLTWMWEYLTQKPEMHIYKCWHRLFIRDGRSSVFFRVGYKCSFRGSLRKVWTATLIAILTIQLAIFSFLGKLESSSRHSLPSLAIKLTHSKDSPIQFWLEVCWFGPHQRSE